MFRFPWRKAHVCRFKNYLTTDSSYTLVCNAGPSIHFPPEVAKTGGLYSICEPSYQIVWQSTQQLSATQEGYLSNPAYLRPTGTYKVPPVVTISSRLYPLAWCAVVR